MSVHAVHLGERPEFEIKGYVAINIVLKINFSFCTVLFIVPSGFLYSLSSPKEIHPYILNSLTISFASKSYFSLPLFSS